MRRRVFACPAGLPARLQEQRILFGLTLNELGALSGNSGTMASHWESGELLPDANAVMAWAEAGLDTTYILTGDPCAEVLTVELDGDAPASSIDRLTTISTWLSAAAIAGVVALSIINIAPTLFACCTQ
ncbi:helix-turn-helix domain-containing protein [Novosphingobium sp. KACC 22771]|uniref:helix-turn-helix domain-containing protein n=1 Tax=Novosphingobium sp. KACC 22771 TaxID=3025670 RepID=UPI002366F082|nr:helix-turn-helix transcriptional regulator [Novosphingobium sp. KACC 22771]WDF73498.1 helix-turn-helix transcriptional regulator [Novosphingobium sp. KACC 22771]